MSTANSHGVVTLSSSRSFSATIERLQTALRERGIKVFATIDQQAEARAVGLDLSPTVLIVCGNPKAGTPLMQAKPESAIDLPLKILIAEINSQRVTVSFNSAAYIIERHSLPAELLANLAPFEKLIAAAID